MPPFDSDAHVLLLLFAYAIAVITLLLLLRVYLVCFHKGAAPQGHLSTSGPFLPARDAAVDAAAAAATAGGTEPALGADVPTWASPRGGSCRWGGDEEAGDCVVCLSALWEDGGGAIRVLPRCRHAFHDGCIGRWLVSNSSLCCPICRTPVRPAPAGPTAAATSPPLPPAMAAAARRDEEAAGGVGGAMRGYTSHSAVRCFLGCIR